MLRTSTVAHACNIPALWEAEAGGPLELRSLSPAWATEQDLVAKKRKEKKGRKGGREGGILIEYLPCARHSNHKC